MNPIRTVRQWWQRTTGEEETPFDGDAPTWVVSMLFHMALLLTLALLPLANDRPTQEITILAEPEEEEALLEEIPPEIVWDPQQQENIGANSEFSDLAAMSLAEELGEISDLPSVDLPITTDEIVIESNPLINIATAKNWDATLVVKGDAGAGETGAVGAVDRITSEIVHSLEERKTLVVWLFDGSGSLTRTREDILGRFDKIYDELGQIQNSGAEQFAKHKDKPLLTSVVAFGNNVSLLTPEPTDDLAEIKSAVEAIPTDETGVERVFSAVYMAANKFKDLRLQEKNGEPERNVMLIVVSDEVGDDIAGLDETVKICRRYAMPVYVIGVPAPFGRKETYVKWVDPDPDFDQTPQWAAVDQGPESLMPEGIRLTFGGMRGEEEPTIDSGFGPFALTRLCYETGGIYFTVHPNRNVNRTVSRRETEAFSAHLEHFFDPQVMRRYRPDYVSRDEYLRRVSSSKMRSSLVQAAQQSWLETMAPPTLTFIKRDEATFANALTNAQRDAAKLEPKLDQLYQIIRLGEEDRPKETSPRWQAGYDLAYGRILAAKVRTESMNAMLANAKGGLKGEDPKSNTWTLTPTDEVSVGSQLQAMADKARTSLNRVVEEHPGTPWALLAEKELETPLGWSWIESYTAPPEPRAMGPANPNVNNNAPNRAAERPNMLEKPTPRRAPPKL